MTWLVKVWIHKLYQNVISYLGGLTASDLNVQVTKRYQLEKSCILDCVVQTIEAINISHIKYSAVQTVLSKSWKFRHCCCYNYFHFVERKIEKFKGI